MWCWYSLACSNITQPSCPFASCDHRNLCFKYRNKWTTAVIKPSTSWGQEHAGEKRSRLYYWERFEDLDRKAPSPLTVLSETLLCRDSFPGESDVMGQMCQRKLMGWMKSAAESTCCWHHLPIVVTQGQLSTTKHSSAQGQQPGESSCISASHPSPLAESILLNIYREITIREFTACLTGCNSS